MLTVDTSLQQCSWLSGGPLFKVWTQLEECRYKFLCRWAQYGRHMGAQDWEINQYETGWIRASVWSFPWVNLFFFAPSVFLPSSPSTNWRKVHGLLSFRLLFLSLVQLTCAISALWPTVLVHWGDHERKWRLQYVRVCCRIQKGYRSLLFVNKPWWCLGKPWGVLTACYSFGLAVSFSV